MRKILLLILIFVLVAIVILAQFRIFAGKAPADLGVVKSHLGHTLKPPSTTQNSVSSQAEFFSKTEANVEYAKMEPFNYKGDGKAAMATLKEVINTNFKEAQLISENEAYLHYEFKSGLMKFIDDVEFLLNENENYIHFRSASRLGRKDFGKNRERMEAIRRKFSQ